jgi:thiamine kinase-like enzyme
VIWRDSTSPVLIDWEGAGLINPTEEVINVAMEWAGMTEILFRKNIFSAVIESYRNNGGYIVDKADSSNNRNYFFCNVIAIKLLYNLHQHKECAL